MRTRMALACWLLLSSPVFAEEPNDDDIVELSPDLYLLMHTARAESYVGLRMDALRRANDFATRRGGVAVPVMGRHETLGFGLKLYEYQFRVMSVDQAKAAQPVLADAVITVNNIGQCAPNAAVAAMLHGAPAPEELRLIARRLSPGSAESLPLPQSAPETTPDNDGAGTFCLPGQLCKPAQVCLPGWQCTPGTMPTPEPPAAPTPPETLDPDSIVRINAELVQLHVRVIDRNNRPINDVPKNAFHVFEDGGTLSGLVEYSTDLFEERTIEALVKNFQVLLESVVEDPDCTVQRLPMPAWPGGGGSCGSFSCTVSRRRSLPRRTNTMPPLAPSLCQPSRSSLARPSAKAARRSVPGTSSVESSTL